MWTVIDSPIGELRLVADQGALRAVDFSPFQPPADGRPLGPQDGNHPVLAHAVAELRAYFAGELRDFTVPLAPVGTEFQLKVWGLLQQIPWGTTTSYGALAAQLGYTNAASRAVGLANGRNPIPVIIPCHRVIGADGSLTGYAGGLGRKQTLLDLEQGALF